MLERGTVNHLNRSLDHNTAVSLQFLAYLFGEIIRYVSYLLLCLLMQLLRLFDLHLQFTLLRLLHWNRCFVLVSQCEWCLELSNDPL